MLSLEDCREILQAHIEKDNLTDDREIGLTGWVDAGEFCFAFGVNSTKFIETGNFDFCLVGAGPTIVDRRNGKVIPMANNGWMENYEKRGDPYNGLSGILRMTGSYGEGLSQNTFKYLREITGKSIGECKAMIENTIAGEAFIFDTKSEREVDVQKHTTEFQNLGFNVKRLTTFEVRDEKLDTSQSKTG